MFVPEHFTLLLEKWRWIFWGIGDRKEAAHRFGATKGKVCGLCRIRTVKRNGNGIVSSVVWIVNKNGCLIANVLVSPGQYLVILPKVSWINRLNTYQAEGTRMTPVYCGPTDWH